MPTPIKITLSRRRMLALIPTAAALWPKTLLAQNIFARRKKPKPAPELPLVYIGTDTINSKAKGIYVARFNPATGQLSAPSLAAETVRPSFLAAAHVGKNRVLYAANEGQDEASSGASAFVIDPASGALRLLGKVSSGAAGPCYISVDATGSVAFVADYGGSAIASYKVNSDGSLSQPVEKISFKQPAFGHHGPNGARQDAPHPHSATISPNNRFLVVNDLGNDNIVTFFIHADSGRLGAPHLNPSRVPGSGPRHIAFHPNDRWAYGIDELTNKIDHYLWNTTHATGSTEPIALLTNAGNSVSTLDPNFHGPNTAAEIVCSEDGNFLVASNRGENTLAVFHIDGVTGAPAFLQRISCGGKTPRQFTLDLTGKWLLCGNQDSSTVTVFARDESTGRLSGPVQTLAVDMPQMVLFA